MKRKLLFVLAVSFGSLSYAQCDITGPAPIMCISDAPVALVIDSPGGDFVGPGVSDGVFDPAVAGIGIHTISVEAPGVGYTVDDAIAFDPIDIPGGTAVTMGDDNVSAFLPIGFTFTFFGNDYTDFKIGSNGFLTFNSSSSSGCCSGQSIPNGSFPNDVVAFAWEDLDPGNGGAPATNLVRYETVGTAPNRVLVLEFFNVDHWSSGDNIFVHTQLYETTNCVEVHILDQPQSGTHTLGIENSNGTEAYAAPGKNSSGWTASNFAVSFCPNIGCTGTVDVEIIAAPTVEASVDVTEICLGESIVLTGSGTADEYSWGTGIEDGVAFTPTITGENVYILAGTDLAAGCVGSDMVTVFVHDIPYVYAGHDITVCSDNEFTLSAIGDDAVYSWDNGAVDGVSMTQSVGTVVYTVTSTNEGDCEASSSVSVESLEVPTGTGVVTMMTGDAYDGEIDFTPTGGTSTDYTFSWSNGATTEDITALATGTYTVTVSDGTCDSDVTFIVDSQAGFALNELDNLKVYPNPVVDVLTVEFNGSFNWTLFNEIGEVVTAGNGIDKESISMDNLATGTYIIEVEVDGKKSKISVVKK